MQSSYTWQRAPEAIWLGSSDSENREKRGRGTEMNYLRNNSNANRKRDDFRNIADR
jgi:hypothetical protein